jgi:hypothetical protein
VAAKVSRDELYALVKSLGEKRYTLTVAYPADTVDGHGEFIKAQNLEPLAWDYLTKHRQIGLYHADNEIGHGQVVESYIWRGDPWTVEAADGTTQVVKSGSWLLGVIWSPTAWRLIKTGQIAGMSIQGRAKRRPTEIEGD